MVETLDQNISHLLTRKWWIKNIKRDYGNNWAYPDYDIIPMGPAFELNWPTYHGRKNSNTPQYGDVIVLFQTPNEIKPGKKNKIVCLTHLVEVADYTHYENSNKPSHKWCRDVRIIALASPMYAINGSDYFRFDNNIQWGLACDIDKLISKDPKIVSEADKIRMICSLFSNYIYRDGDWHNEEIIRIIEDEGWQEGEAVGVHIDVEIKKRNSDAVRQKKLSSTDPNGRIKCEVCKCDFVDLYGDIGRGFIECHHNIHINQGIRTTSLSDLSVVCANCHRMLHRKNGNGYHTAKSLQELFEANKSKRTLSEI